MDRRHFMKAGVATAVWAALYGSRTALAFSAAPSSNADLAMMDGIATAQAIESGHVSASEVLEAAIRRAELMNPALNAIVTPDYDGARAQLAKNGGGDMWGVPTVIKDLNAWKGLRWSRGSKLFMGEIAEKETPYTQKIRDAGLISLGKSNTPEFGLLPTTESLALGECRNPWNLERICGGSSGGSAAAVAARIVPIAQSSDGGGSIRIPGAMCGVVGLKPSRGRFPDQGNPVRTWDISIKHVNSMSVRDTALALALTEDGSSSLGAVGYVKEPSQRKFKIALSLVGSGGVKPSADTEEAVIRTARLLEEMGHTVMPVEDTPFHGDAFQEAFLANWAATAAGVVQLVEARTGKRAEETGLLEPFTLGLARKHAGAMSNEEIVSTFTGATARVNQFLGTYDLWLSPVTATVAPELGYMAPTVEFDELLQRVLNFVGYTPIHNVAGTPGISVPAGNGTRSGLPVGVQLAAGMGREGILLDIAYQLEEAAPWSQLVPELVTSKL